MKTVIVTVEGGVIQDIEVPEGVEVIVKDYDEGGSECLWEYDPMGVLITKKE